MSNANRLGDNDGLLPLVPGGIYTLTYLYHETGKVFRSPKLTIWFKITDFGPYFGKVVPRYYNIRRLSGKPGKDGRFVVGRSQDFLREYARLFPNPINRLDRISMSPFENKLIKACIREVKRDYRQRELAPPLQYSVVDELIRVDE